MNLFIKIMQAIKDTLFGPDSYSSERYRDDNR